MTQQETVSEIRESPTVWRHARALAGPAVGLQALNLLVSLTGRCLAGNAETATAADQLALQGGQTTCFYLAWMIGSFGILASAESLSVVAGRMVFLSVVNRLGHGPVGRRGP
jgi:hypothetical protein